MLISILDFLGSAEECGWTNEWSYGYQRDLGSSGCSQCKFICAQVGFVVFGLVFKFQ